MLRAQRAEISLAVGVSRTFRSPMRTAGSVEVYICSRGCARAHAGVISRVYVIPCLPIPSISSLRVLGKLAGGQVASTHNSPDVTTVCRRAKPSGSHRQLRRSVIRRVISRLPLPLSVEYLNVRYLNVTLERSKSSRDAGAIRDIGWFITQSNSIRRKRCQRSVPLNAT